ncbi:MAG: sigma-70 family RNA polymerase sigma factor [Lachnospiraceae bacterium]|nr:sigma-70 family RNA polymerase sigma factor [Lachnospiraceae bacterium]
MKPKEVISGILLRKPEVYEELMQDYSRLLWTLAAGILNGYGSREDVEDVISDVFLSLWEHPEQFDEKRGSIKTWLCVKTRSTAIDCLRKKYREVLSAEETGEEWKQSGNLEEDTVFLQFLEKQQTTKILMQIQNLEFPDREILMLRLIYEMKPALIAAKLNLPAAEVYSRIRTGKRRLKKSLEDRE